MKYFIPIISILFCLTSLAFAEESQGLSQQAMESVTQQAREMSALGIPEAQAQKMLTRMVQSRFEKQNQIRAQQVVMDTARAGLPTGPVMSKAMEGMAKQAKQQQVIAAMETVRSRYAYGYRMAKNLSDDKRATDTMANAIAGGLAAGMQAEDMDGIMAQLQIQTRQQTRNQAEALSLQTMQTARTMARMGIHSTDVTDTLCQALQNQYTHQEMQQLHHQFTKNAHQASPQQVANKHAEAIGKGRRSSDSDGGLGIGSPGSGSGAGGEGSGSGAGGEGSGSGAGGEGSGSGAGGEGSGGGAGDGGSGGGSGGSN